MTAIQKAKLISLVESIECASEDIGYYQDGSVQKHDAYIRRRNLWAVLEKLLGEIKTT